MSSSCIDLLFTSQPNLVMESGVHSSLRPNCNHRVVFAKLNLSILYPPPYQRTVWFYRKANPELIRRVINEFDWIGVLSNVSVDEKVCYFTETLLNIIHNFIPRERIVCDYRDSPWINNKIKKLISEKNSAYKSYCRFNRDVFLFEKFLQIENSKQSYYSKLSSKLANPATSLRTYWSILKIFLNNKKNSLYTSSVS